MWCIIAGPERHLGHKYKNNEDRRMDKYNLYAKTLWRRLIEHCKQNQMGQKKLEQTLLYPSYPRISARARDHF
jgi:hypothetical protein